MDDARASVLATSNQTTALVPPPAGSHGGPCPPGLVSARAISRAEQSTDSRLVDQPTSVLEAADQACRLPSSSPECLFDPAQEVGELGRMGGYRILAGLGEGGMGVVYLARHCSSGRSVAIKVLRPEEAQDDLSRNRFLREARVQARLRNEHVVRIDEVGYRDSVPYLVMEYVPGMALSELLRYELATTPRQILRLGIELADGLASAHDQGLVHRDLKPANILIAAPTCAVKLTDFGLARSRSDVRLTRTGIILGTPAYMAPEQARGETVDVRCDLFSLGCVLYEVCCGTPPFRGKTAYDVLQALATHTPTPVRALNPTIPAALAEVIHHLLEKRPDARPASGRVVLEQLRRIERGQRRMTLVSTVTAVTAPATDGPSNASRQ